MAKIILIETSTALCSVALAVDGKAVCSRESGTPKAHASLTAVFVREVLGEAGLAAGGCDAVCVSAGPGSYTGLRVGVSTAKGLCFAAGLPLLSICTLDILATQAVRDGHVSGECRHIDPRDYLERLGFITGNKNFERIGIPFTGNAFDDEMMLLKNFEGNTLDLFLEAYRKAGITPVILKAALTPTNIHWNTLQLYEELARERRAFEAFMKP